METPNIEPHHVRGGPTDPSHDAELRRGILRTEVSRPVASALLASFLLVIYGVPIAQAAQFAIDYTFWFNTLFVIVAGWLVLLHRRHVREMEGGMVMDMEGGGPLKRAVTYLFIAILAGGALAYLVTGGAG